MDHIARAKPIKLLVLDVDGVLTNGQLVIGPEGEAHKCFHAHDGMGISLARKAGIRTAIITGRSSRIVAQRAAELKITDIYQGTDDKGAALRDIMSRAQLRPEQVAYVGDDINDLPALLQAGLACAVANAVPEVQQRAHYISTKTGGCGAVREIIELILKAQGKWEALIDSYLQEGTMTLRQ